MTALNKKKALKPVLVVGAGSWGTALAELIASNGFAVRLWSHRASQIDDLRHSRENTQYLPGFKLSKNIEFFSDLAAALSNEPAILIVVPSHAIEDTLFKIREITLLPAVVWGTKGVEAKSEALISTRVQHYFPDSKMAMLSGPSFAKEVMQRLPTAISISSKCLDFAEEFASYLRSDYFRVYANEDLIAAEVAGAVKNVLAIACGIADGLGFGANTRAAVITRGLVEMRRLGVEMGGQAMSFTGLAGLGDLVLTCTDNLSRNRRFGLLLGEGYSIDSACKKIGQVVEGMYNASQVTSIAKKLSIELPICQEVAAILTGTKKPQDAVNCLLSREPSLE